METDNRFHMSHYFKCYLIPYFQLKEQILLTYVSCQFKAAVLKYLSLQNDQFSFFMKYYYLFEVLFKINPHSPYCNLYFKQINLCLLKYPQKMNIATIQTLIASFINSHCDMISKPFYSMNLMTKKDILFHEGILKQLLYTHEILYFIYSTSTLTLNYSSLLLDYISKYYQSNVIDYFSLNYIAQHQEHRFPSILLSEENLSNVINYSSIYPNHISKINYQFHEEENVEQSLTKLISLNRLSIFEAPSHYLEHCNSYPNLRFLEIDVNKRVKLPQGFNYSQITLVRIQSLSMTTSQSILDDLMSELNKMTILKKVIFRPSCILTYDIFITFFKVLSATNLTKIVGDIIEYPECCNLSFLIEKFPLLDQLAITFENCNNIDYDIFDIFSCSKMTIPIKMLIQMINNYLRKSYRRLQIYFYKYTAFNMVMSEILQHKHIIDRIYSIKLLFTETAKLTIPFVTKVNCYANNTLLPVQHSTFIIVTISMLHKESSYYNYIKGIDPLVIEIIKIKETQSINDDIVDYLDLFKQLPQLIILLDNDQIIYAKIGKSIQKMTEE